jgi:hypothetical protein
MSLPVSTSDAVRLQQPESLTYRGQCSFAEYLVTAVAISTLPVINPQRRSIHRVSPRGSSSCYVNFPDSANLSNSAVLSLFDAIPRDPPLSRLETGGICFGQGLAAPEVSAIYV